MLTAEAPVLGPKPGTVACLQIPSASTEVFWLRYPCRRGDPPQVVETSFNVLTKYLDQSAVGRDQV